MLLNRRPFSVLLFLIALLPPLSGAEIGPFTGPEADAEAERLYERANDYVNNVVEGQYSYSYIQFHWKRAGSNIDRILRAYPSSPAAAAVKGGTHNLGTFTPEYFKERVLPRLEEKKVAAFDAVNCAIFLYYLESNRDPVAKKELLTTIVQTLCRQIRWGEALGFPVLDNERPWLWNTVIRQTSIYRNDKLTDELLTNIVAESKPQLVATVAEGLAFRGETPAALDVFLQKEGDSPALRAAIFNGLIRRQLPIERALAASRPLKGLYSGVDGIQHPEQPAADLVAWLQTIPAGKERDDANRNYAHYLANLGRLDEARALVPSDRQAGLAFSYASHLVAIGDFEGAQNLPAVFALTGAQADQFRLRLLELMAESGPDKDTAAVRALIPPTLLTQAVYRQTHGLIISTEKHLMVREHTFSDLLLTDPNLLGRLICEWSLTPNRALRGAAPWDNVVYKFAPGFADLPPPQDKKKVEAAGR